MKKTFLMIFAALACMACSDDSLNNEQNGETKTEPATEVYIQGQKRAATRAGAAETATAYFFIRVDNRIPGAERYPSSYYFPQNAMGGTIFGEGNKGTVDLSYPSWCNNSSYPMYVYDTTGKATEKTISSQPSLKDLLNANRNYTFEMDKINTDTLKVIWYIVKKQDGIWHVDGVLTGKSTKDVTEVPDIDEDKDLDNKKEESTVPAEGDGNVEVDIHQQAHKDWSEIKTSIHVRDEVVKSVVVEIPIGKENVAEQDDFAIRTWDLTLDAKVWINGVEYSLNTTNPAKVTIEHKADKVVYTIDCSNAAEYIKALRKEYGDGLTVEIHTYGKGLTDAQVWEKLKKATVTVNPSGYKHLIYKGATSAYFTE